MNQLLASLPRADDEALLPHLHDVQVDHRQWLSRPNESIEDVYFPRGAVTSMLVPMADGQSVEGATIGLEGLAGIAVFLGEEPTEAEVICQVPVNADRFRMAFERSPALHRQLLRYTHALISRRHRDHP